MGNGQPAPGQRRPDSLAQKGPVATQRPLAARRLEGDGRSHPQGLADLAQSLEQTPRKTGPATLLNGQTPAEILPVRANPGAGNARLWRKKVTCPGTEKLYRGRADPRLSLCSVDSEATFSYGCYRRR